MVTKPKLSIPFKRIQSAILPGEYELSFNFIGPARSRELNRKYRGKDKPTNVLSFPLSETSGEIFIDLATAKKEASGFGMSYKKFIGYLFIHGLLHLKGMEHGKKMEKEEKKFLEIFFG